VVEAAEEVVGKELLGTCSSLWGRRGGVQPKKAAVSEVLMEEDDGGESRWLASLAGAMGRFLV
jgi:hypothetical protein